MPPLKRRAAALAAALLMTTACTTVGPNFASPAARSSQGYAMAGDAPNDAAVQLGATAASQQQWWRAFNSPELNGVVETALANNPDVAAAEAALRPAQADASAARGGAAPQVNADASISRERVNTAAFGIEGFPSPTITLYSVGSSASFDLDLFGGTRRRIESAEAREQAQARRTDAAYLALSGNVVVKAIEVAALKAQIEATNAIIAEDQHTADIIHRGVEGGGLAHSAEVTAHAQLAEDQARLPPLQLRYTQARHALALLAGATPDAFNPPDIDLATIALPGQIPVSLPSELVRRRPDILAAEADLHAATADIGVATAALYPRVSLDAAFSLATFTPENFFNYESSGWNVGPSITAPLFHGGALRAERRGAEATRDEAMARYQRTVIGAFVQVADLLQALTQDRALVAAQTEAASAATENARLARLAFDNGAGTLLSVLDAQRQAQRAQLGLIEANAALRRDAATLFVATAADWRGGA